MRPKHNRHSYKGSKFRKKYPETNFNLYSKWLANIHIPKCIVPDPYREGMYPYMGGGRGYKICRKLYNAHYKLIKTEHKKNGGFLIGDQFWYKTNEV